MKDASAEAGCTYNVATQARMTWSGKIAKVDRDRVAAALAERRASGIPDEVERPLPVFDLARLASIRSPDDVNATVAAKEIDEPKQMPAVPTAGKGKKSKRA